MLINPAYWAQLPGQHVGLSWQTSASPCGWTRSGLHDLRHLCTRLTLGVDVPPYPLPAGLLLEGSPMPSIPPGVSSLQIDNEGDAALLRTPALPAAPGLQAKYDATSSAYTAPGRLCLQQNG